MISFDNTSTTDEANSGCGGHIRNNGNAITLIVPLGTTMLNIIQSVILQTLALCDNNRSLAAEKLGISRRTIQRYLKIILNSSNKIEGKCTT